MKIGPWPSKLTLGMFYLVPTLCPSHIFPPGRFARSNTVTCQPLARSRKALVRPPTPLPITIQSTSDGILFSPNEKGPALSISFDFCYFLFSIFPLSFNKHFNDYIKCTTDITINDDMSIIRSLFKYSPLYI